MKKIFGRIVSHFFGKEKSVKQERKRHYMFDKENHQCNCQECTCRK